MLRIKSSVLLPSLALLLFVGGCQKSADQSPAPDSASNSSPNGAPGGTRNGPSSSGKSSILDSLSSKPLVVPADTTITVVLDEPLSSKTSESGQNFAATVSTPIEIDGKIAVPKGARATGVVREAKSAGRFKGGAVLSLVLSSITVNKSSYNVETSDHSLATKGKGKRSAALIGGGGVAGAIIGGLAGGGKGAAAGAALGAGAGTGGAAFTGNREINLPAETPLSFKLLQPLEIKR